jgi:2-oxopent-4-enoate/cis-2-oxohex-4-enoate hydratase
MEQMQIDDLGDALYLAMRERRMLSPLTETYPELTIEDAYAI